MSQSSFFDARHLLQLRERVDALDPDGPPRARYLVASSDEPPRRLALLPGSFNPPTNAHVAMSAAVLTTGRVDRVDFLLATRTVNKERVEGASLPDRLLMLEALSSSAPHQGVVLVNRGLLVDQAELIRSAAPTVIDLWFAVGFDKIIQILDPRYYRDRDVALDRLFALARFFVAPRGNAEFDDLEALLSRSENRRYADRIVELNLPVVLREVSSSRLRSHDPASIADLPEVARQFIHETGAYGVEETKPELPDRYEARERVLDRLQADGRALPTNAGFRAAVEQLRDSDLRSHPPSATSRGISENASRPHQVDLS